MLLRCAIVFAAGLLCGCQVLLGIEDPPAPSDAAVDAAVDRSDAAGLDAAVDPWLSKTLTIRSDMVEAPGQGELVDFPLLVSLVDTDLAAAARGDGRDIHFVDSDGITVLAHEMEKWDKASGELIAWVRLPSLSATQDKAIEIRYGEPDADMPPDPAAVWASAYAAVYHLNNLGQPSEQLLDSTGNGNHGTKVAATEPALDRARIGDGQVFDGQGDYITIADSDSLDLGASFSASLWLSYDKGMIPNDFERILCKKAFWDAGTGWEISLESGYDNALTVRGGGQPGGAALSNMPSWQAGGWHHLVVVYRSGTATAYVDGQWADDATIGLATDNGEPLYIGRYGSSGATNFWMGPMDEIRLIDTELSPEWIATEYRNQYDPAGFYTVGPQQ